MSEQEYPFDWRYDPRKCAGPSYLDDIPLPTNKDRPTMVCPSDSNDRKAIPLARGLFDYFPDALVEVARLSLIGNDKHNPGQPLHWSRDKSTDHADCILRHMLDRGTLDTDGLLHDVKVAWRAIAQLQLALEARKKAGT